MMRPIIAIIIVLFLFFKVGSAQPDPFSGIDLPKTTTSIFGDDDCLLIYWGFENYQNYLIGCPEVIGKNFNWMIVVDKNRCEKSSCELQIVTVKFDGKAVTDLLPHDFNKNVYDLSNFIAQYETSHFLGTIKAEMIIRRICNGTITEKRILRHIRFIQQGDAYQEVEHLGPGYPYGYLPCEMEYIDSNFKDILYANRACCDITKEVKMTSEIKTVTQQGGLGNSSLSVSFKIFGAINLSFRQRFNIPSKTVNYSNSFSSSSSVTLEGRNGICEYPAIQIEYEEYEVRTFIADCDYSTPDEEIGNENILVPINFSLVVCQINFENPCPELNPIIRENQIPEISGLNCNQELSLEAESPESIYQIRWITPNGTVIEDVEQIFADEIGLYQCIVIDNCCNEKTLYYNNCETVEYGPWYYQNGEYCRDVLCDCEDIITLRKNSSKYEMCVEADRYDEEWSFNETTKKCNKHTYWTDQDGIEWDLSLEVAEADIESGDVNLVKDPIVHEYYDDFEQKCIREYSCDVGISFGILEYHDPDYGDWNYNEYLNSCFREVMCFGGIVLDDFGQEFEDEAENSEIVWSIENNSEFLCTGVVFCEEEPIEDLLYSEPNAEWALDEFFNTCITTYLSCDGETQQNISEDPSYFDEWEWDGNLFCNRDVFCETADDFFTQVSGALFYYDESNSANCDTNNGEYTYQVNCTTDDIIGWFCLHNKPSNPDENLVFDPMIDFNPNEVSRIVVQTKNYQNRINTTGQSFQKYTLYLFTIDGKLKKKSVVKTKSDIDHYIKYYNRFEAEKGEMYFITVLGDNQFLYTQKIINF